ncbi:MAG: L,D-transpeptidase [Campylobacterota bacterium]|nr:L,D-transpeptidase [Campylobacterota bacterium]
MIKLILPLLLTNTIFGNTIDINIENLRDRFNNEVIETNIFRTRFNNYLKSKCDDNFECFSNYIKLLKKWDTVKEDNTLWSFYEKKAVLFQYDQKYWDKLNNKLLNKDLNLQESQFVSVVDLENQLFIITLWSNISKKFYFIGQDFISSGDIKREVEIKYGEDHYLKTPSGTFQTHTGWRSDGKYKDDNVTLGYGYKDRYIFYFGKQESIRYNTFDKEKNKIKDKEKWQLITDELEFALHAHKSNKPMGQPYSHGCIRTSDELNRFIDNNLVLHKNMIDGKKWLHKYSKEPEKPKYYDLAGEYLIIFDKI